MVLRLWLTCLHMYMYSRRLTIQQTFLFPFSPHFLNSYSFYIHHSQYNHLNINPVRPFKSLTYNSSLNRYLDIFIYSQHLFQEHTQTSRFPILPNGEMTRDLEFSNHQQILYQYLNFLCISTRVLAETLHKVLYSVVLTRV